MPSYRLCNTKMNVKKNQLAFIVKKIVNAFSFLQGIGLHCLCVIGGNVMWRKWGIEIPLDLKKKTHRLIFLKNSYEKAIKSVVSQLKEKEIFIDVGAHIGYYSLLAATKGANVFSFEPNEENYRQLQINITNNKLYNVRIFKIAVGSERKQTDLFISEQNDGGHSVFKKYPTVGKKEIVQMDLLDNYLQKADLIKIDSEGNELQILKGMENILRNSPNIKILCEVSGNYSELNQFLKDHSFEIYLLQKHHNVKINSIISGQCINYLFCKK